MTWKILTAQIRKEIYDSLINCKLFPKEQKGYCKGTRGAELPYIIFNESKAKRKNLAMAWIDNKKANDTFPQSWIIYCRKMYKLSNEIIKFIEKTMETWRVELTARGKSLAKVKIQRGSFQGDILSPLLFVNAMMPLNYIFRKCTDEYKLTKSQETINHLVYMDDIKLFAKNKREIETLIQTVRIYNQDIGMEFGIEFRDETINSIISKCSKLAQK